MAESILDLIDVSFQDATNHVSFSSDDIMGLVMPYYWGESDKVRIYNKTTFNEMFPESLPIGVTSLTDNDRDIYSGYAQVKNYFDHGGGEVEIFRPSTGFGFQRMTIASDGVVSSISSQTTKHDETKSISIALKYAGYVPQSMALGYDNIVIGVKSVSIDGYSGNAIQINVYGKKGSLTTNTTSGTSQDCFLLETFEGSANPLANISGESIYLENIVNSNFIEVRVFGEVSGLSSSESIKACVLYDNGEDGNVVFDSTMCASIKTSYKYFRDFEISNCSLIINPLVKATTGSDFSSTNYMKEIDGEIASVAEYRKTCLAVIGYPTNESYNKDDIQDYFSTDVASNALGNKFCIALQGREYVSLFGYRVTLNCASGYVGEMISVAEETKSFNQIASATVWGKYGGSLKDSLLSGEVIDMMEKFGINSVYASKTGNLIWGTRTMYSRQQSYFGKINVMRVCSMILRNIFPIAIETLHTDAASNPITRASLSTMLNSIISTFIAKGDLQTDSIADCSDSINTDYLTKGGTILNIILNLHFFGLVERVSIKIVATDTSVNAEFI